MIMERPQVHKRNPLGIPEMDPELPTPNQVREQRIADLDRRTSERRMSDRRAV